MASNALPTTEYRLIALAQAMHSGLVALGDELKITQITAAEFEVEFRAFVAASRDFNAARSGQQSASSLSKPADAALETWLQGTRNILMARFGTRWSATWAQ